MTLVIVIIVGLLGTLLFGYMVYRHWATSVPMRGRPTQATTVAQPMAPLTPPPHVFPTRNKKRWFLWLVMILILTIIGYFSWSYWLAGVRDGLRSSSSLSRLPAEAALQIIAQCESRGLQFNPDGSVVTNKNKNGTIDRGKWQINSSHDAETKRLGIDISTEEGNEKFARILYAKNELRDWEATRHCWEPKLLALGHSPGLSPSLSTPTPDNTFVVVVRPGRPAEVVMPPNWLIVWWGKKSNFTSHAIWRGSDKVRVFTVRPGVGSADIKIHRYHDPDPNWWRRQ